MAVSPQELQAALKKEAAKFEIEIDGVLRGKTIGINDSVSISVPKGMTHSHFTILKQKYIDVGWKEVRWDSFDDQREIFRSYGTITFKS